MANFSYQDARVIINEICEAAGSNAYPSRKSFMDMVDANPHIAVQGYNAYCKIFYWNSASISLYGYREEEAVNQDFTELILPTEMRSFALDMVANGARTGKMPVAGACDLLNADGKYVTVYSGHVVFQWDNATTPEFYCIDLPIETDPV
jgi:PAS domain S-box-containing protein